MAVAWIAGFLDLRRRSSCLLLGGLGVGSALAVAWVTLQARRGVPSHFAADAIDGSPSGFDEALYIGAGLTIAVVVVILLTVTVLAFRRPVAAASRAVAIRVGLVLLLVGQGLGGAISAHGTAIDRPPTEVDLAIFGAAGAMKVPHAMALHAVQVLPLSAWLLGHIAIPERRRTAVVAFGALGYTALVAASAVQTFSGHGPLDLVGLGSFLAVSGVMVWRPASFWPFGAWPPGRAPATAG